MPRTLRQGEVTERPFNGQLGFITGIRTRRPLLLADCVEEVGGPTVWNGPKSNFRSASFTRLRARCDVMADRSDREQGQPNLSLRRHSLKSRMGPCSRTPSGPAVSTDCINRPDRRLHPTNATASIYLLQRGSHPQRTQVGHCAVSVSCANKRHSPSRFISMGTVSG